MPREAHAPAPLEGVRVVEAANYVAAPAVGALLRDLGADVIKVEPPGGEVMRGVVAADAEGTYKVNFLFELENRGKRSVTIDLRSAAGQQLLRRLLANADVFLTNLLGPRLERYGLAPQQLLADYPQLVVCSITGYGLSGPEAGRPGFDFAAFWARSGIMSLIGHREGPPVISRIAQGDHTTAMNALAAILAALRLRDRTGRGTLVEVSLQQTGVYTIATDVARTLIDGKQPSRFDRTAPANPLFNTYPTADGHWIMLVHMTPDPYWPKLCAALERPEWAADPRYATMKLRQQHGRELAARIEAEFRARTLREWADRLDAHGLIWAPMVELPDVVEDPSLAALDAFPEVDHPNGRFRTVGVPFRLHGADVGVRGPSPDAGQHTFEVLREAGLSEDEIADFAARGALG
ncbi:MAG: CoA transferase [Chloroflexota bacterium]|nr:CoA transferase [Dehalococcoidia bacterium]MDW8045744.1 CoA transferase [Chloroflexota bacterium]